MSSTVQNIRAKIKRRFSHKNEPDPQNFDEYDSNDEGQDEETSAYLAKESEKAEADGYDQGKPGSLLNRMIMHGNKKTEEQIASEGRTTGAGGVGTSTGATTGVGGAQSSAGGQTVA